MNSAQSVRQARHEFAIADEHLTRVRRGKQIELAITADALYQVWLNGRMLGHGPAKSAKGTRGVDVYDLAGHVVSARNVWKVVIACVERMETKMTTTHPT